MLIMDAMEEAGLALGAWAPLNAHHIPDKNSTFPLTMDIAFERRRSVSAQADTTPAYAQALSLFVRTELGKMPDESQAAVEHEKETKTIYVVFNSFDDTKNCVMLIMDAMEEAGLA